MFTKAVQSVFIILTEGSIFFGISFLLLYIEPIGALIVVTTLGFSGWIIFKLTRGLIERWGEARQIHEGLRIQHLQQGLGSTKDVMLLGRESEFIDQYQIHNAGSAKVSQLWFTIQAMPRLWLELLAVFGLVILVLAMIEQNKPLDVLVPMLGLFAAAAFRIMPSVNRVLGAFQGVRYALPAIDKLYDEFKLMEGIKVDKGHADFRFQEVITLNKIRFSYPMTETSVLVDISLKIPRGATVGFVGTTGAGKSTLIDIILGLLTPDSGFIQADGIDIQSNLRGWQDQIGYVPQSIYLTDDSLRRNVAFGISEEHINEAAVWKAIRAAHLESFINELPRGLDTFVGERGVRLSGGQRQRIGIARALYHDPQVLVLDEATSSLDNITERGVMDAVHDLHGKKTIIIVAHRLSTVEHCDRLYRLEQGKVVEEGTPANILYEYESST
jgi:ABC-type multidrug transport system fused ATPase/permease subunit